MVIIKKRYSTSETEAHIEVYADSLSELTSDILGSITIAPGSVAYDSNGDVAIYTSNETWNTVQ